MNRTSENLRLQNDLYWERIFIANPSLPQRIFWSSFIAAIGFGISFLLVTWTGTYFTFVGILTIVLISLFSGKRLAFFYSAILSMLNDYFFIPPIGSIFENRKSFEHLIIICGAGLATALLTSSLRTAFKKVAVARRDAERARKDMEKVLALVSHDVRNPLATAKMGAQLILETAPKENQAHLALIVRNLERADILIQTLLDVSSIRMGKSIPLKYVHCDLSAEIGSLIEEMSLMHKNRLKFAPEPIWGNWGMDGIRRALENLIANAIKYGGLDFPITISATRSGECAVISVHNLGNEIPKEDQKMLFDYFQRGSENGNQKGWGLGLALVKGVAEAHGGEVFLESGDGAGTRFTMKIPSQK